MTDMGGWDNMTVGQKIEEIQNKFIAIGAAIGEHIMPWLDKILAFFEDEDKVKGAVTGFGILVSVWLGAKIAGFTTKAITNIGKISTAFRGVGIAAGGAAVSPGMLALTKVLAAVSATMGPLIALGSAVVPSAWIGSLAVPGREHKPISQEDFGAVGARFIPTGADTGVSPMIPGAARVPGAFRAQDALGRTGAGTFAFPGASRPEPERVPFLDALPPVPRREPQTQQPTPGIVPRSTWIDEPRPERGGGSPIHPFAEGGIVTEPTIGLVGEAGPEAVIPLSEAAVPTIIVNITTNNLLGTKEELLRDIREGLNEAYRRNPSGNFRYAARKRV